MLADVRRVPFLSVPREAGLTQAIGRSIRHMRTYELVFVVDPRVSDEDVVAMTQEYKQMITAGGSQISKEESWGRRKLAYPIAKLNEGKYVLLGIESEGGKSSLPEVEHRMRQNDKILRYLTVRTDEDLKRAASRHPKTAARNGESPAGLAAPGGEPASGPAPAGEV
jgi:small subunit ribosomal protein S6